MYRIAVLAEKEAEGNHYAEQVERLCGKKGMFPQIVQCTNQKRFFEGITTDTPTNAVVAVSGITGLNTVEHLRSLYPACRIIWCSDQDFSLHAFRLRVDYFLLKPISEEAFEQGLNVWFK